MTKNECRYTSIPPYVFMARFLVKHRETMFRRYFQIMENSIMKQ